VSEIREAVSSRGGVLTLSWHDRSLAPERLWDGFYRRLLEELTRDGAWFATAREIVAWFRARRSIRFDEVGVADGAISVSLSGTDVEDSGFVIRVHVQDEGGRQVVEVPWNGEQTVRIPIPVRRPVAVS
jgi:hypothetical protein